MKKILLLGTACLMCLGTSFAQRKQNTVTYTKATSLGLITGKANYHYIIGENGSNIKDGSLNINAQESYEFNRLTLWGNLDVRYKLDAVFSNGGLYGAASSSCKVSGSLNNTPVNMQCNFSGNFIKGGIPHGDFKVKNNISLEDYDIWGAVLLNAHYDNGILTGAYEYIGPNKYGREGMTTSVKGSLNPEGIPTGTWIIGNDKYEFIDGVLISKTTRKSSTKPAVTEMSRKYAAGEINKEQLLNLGYTIRQDSLTIGNYARMAILSLKDGFDFESLQGYNLSKRNNPKYEYLTERAYISDEGAAYLVETVKKFTLDDRYSDPLISKEGDIYWCINTDEDQAYISIRNWDGFKNYLQNPSIKLPNYEHKAYLTSEQMNAVDSCINAAIASQAVTLSQAIFGSDQVDAGSYIKQSINSGKATATKLGMNLSDSEILRSISSALRDSKDLQLMELNDNYCLLSYSPDISQRVIIKTNSINDYNTTLKNISKEITVYSLRAPFEFMVDASKASKIAYSTTDNGSCEDFFYTESTVSYWQADFADRLKPFCDIIGYEIVDVDTDNRTVLCNIIKKGKKKKDPSIIYQISIKYNNEMRLCAESFDITKAKQL